MDTDTLRHIRLEMCYNKVNMAVALGLRYNTYKAYESGTRKIPIHVANTVKRARQRNRDTMKQILRNIDERIDAQFPNGIPSEVREP